MIKLKKKTQNIKKKESSKNSPAVLGWVCLTHVLGPMFLFFFFKKKNRQHVIFVCFKENNMPSRTQTYDLWLDLRASTN
jgi:hypothetical protein